MAWNKQWNQSPYESGNWNVAQGYSNDLILAPLVRCDNYEKIAFHGTAEMHEVMQMTEEMKTMARIRGLEYLNKEIESLINNTLFAVRKNDKDQMYKNLKFIQGIRKEIDQTYILVKNQISKVSYFKIHEEKFHKLLGMMSDMKREMLKILNQSKLIFPMEEALDPDEIKRQIFEDYVNAG